MRIPIGLLVIALGVLFSSSSLRGEENVFPCFVQ